MNSIWGIVMSWRLLWELVLAGALVGFGVLAVATTIGGALDIRRMLRSLARREKQRGAGGEPVDRFR